MKTKLIILLLFVLSLASVKGQGIFTLPPVPVTNSLTGELADSSIWAGLYYGPLGASEDSLLFLPPALPLTNGCAWFGTHVSIPGFFPGSPVELQIRAWSSPYPTYEDAINSGLSSVLTGKSAVFVAVAGDISSPPPMLVVPGFTIELVPEASPMSLGLLGAGMLWLWRQRKRVRSDASEPL